MNNQKDQKENLVFPAHILVISDDLDVAKIWAFSLEQSGLKVSLAKMEEQSLQSLGTILPDLVVVDSHAWRGEDIKFCGQLRTETVTPLLLFTSQNDEYYLLEAYQAGIDEVVAQPVSPRLFMAKIRSWLRHTQSMPSSVLDELQVGDFRLNEEHRLLHMPDGHSVHLTYLETRLLYLLMGHPDCTQETLQLVKRIWGHYAEGDSALLKNLVYRLRHKIELDPSHPSLLITEGSHGYRFHLGKAPVQPGPAS
jgi:DNA-binding response OmpR family regulator